jgi:hypothetical protein
MNDPYVIYSPGRTGSHIILEMLTGQVGTKGGLADAHAVWLPTGREEYQRLIKDQNVVIHLHSLEEIRDLDKSTVTLILSLRKNLFAQTMSMCVAQIVDEWSGKNYSNKIVQPVAVDKTKFLDQVTRLRNWLHWPLRVNLSNYKKIVTIYYEDLVDQGAELVARELNLTYNKSQVGQVYQPSPYRYKDIILNWKELQQEYSKISNSAVS